MVRNAVLFGRNKFLASPDNVINSMWRERTLKIGSFPVVKPGPQPFGNNRYRGSKDIYIAVLVFHSPELDNLFVLMLIFIQAIWVTKIVDEKSR